MIKDDLHVLAYKYMNNNDVMQFNFNYLNRENNLVGTIDIDATGNMKWEIIDLGYKEFFFKLLPYLYVGDIDNKISYESTSPNGLRWTRATIYAKNNNIPVRYSVLDDGFYEERRMSR